MCAHTIKSFLQIIFFSSPEYFLDPPTSSPSQLVSYSITSFPFIFFWYPLRLIRAAYMQTGTLTSNYPTEENVSLH